MAGNRRTNRYNNGRGDEARMAAALDERAEFEEFKAQILPKLRKMIKQGKSASDIYKFAESFAAAKAVSMAMSSPDQKIVLQSIKEILDRGTGRATERVELTTRYEALTDDALDRMLEQQEAQLGIIQDEDVPH
jgi:hypothetical protein